MPEMKLHIEISGQVLDIEGDRAHVQDVYRDFMERMAGSRADGNASQGWLSPFGPANANGPGVQAGKTQTVAADIAPIFALTHSPGFDDQTVGEESPASQQIV